MLFDVVHYVLLAIIVYQLFERISTVRRLEKANHNICEGWTDNAKAWAIERKDLMDRIQAPSFAEYTNKVIREKKVEKQEEEKSIEFIS